MIHDVSHKHHDTYRIVRKLAILIMQAYDGISLWTCGNILASSNTTSCLIICLLNVRNLIQTIHNMYTMSFWKHILSQKHQLTKELPCTGDQSALIVCCFELFPLSQLADRVYVSHHSSSSWPWSGSTRPVSESLSNKDISWSRSCQDRYQIQRDSIWWINLY